MSDRVDALWLWNWRRVWAHLRWHMVRFFANFRRAWAFIVQRWQKPYIASLCHLCWVVSPFVLFFSLIFPRTYHSTLFLLCNDIITVIIIIVNIFIARVSPSKFVYCPSAEALLNDHLVLTTETVVVIDNSYNNSGQGHNNHHRK